MYMYFFFLLAFSLTITDQQLFAVYVLIITKYALRVVKYTTLKNC